jgi:hypothetical protein
MNFSLAFLIKEPQTTDPAPDIILSFLPCHRHCPHHCLRHCHKPLLVHNRIKDIITSFSSHFDSHHQSTDAAILTEIPGLVTEFANADGSRGCWAMIVLCRIFSYTLDGNQNHSQVQEQHIVHPKHLTP